MAIITLTTDLGYKDFYQAALKGSILSQLPGATIIDISHHISAFNIQQAAFVLKNAFHYFPKETVHLIGIDSVYNESTRYLALKYKDHYFVGSDNGIFSLLCDYPPDEIVELNIMQDLKYLHFPLSDIFSKAACHLAAGGQLSEIGLPVAALEQRMTLQPVIEKDLIRGSVIYIDSFQNVITNITKDLFTKLQRNRNFTLFFRKNESISQLSWHYNEVPEGEKLCLFGISNHLEIAINKGNASGLLGLHINDIIRIEFH
jgi:S-adenosyl-L-methionine hydrolase (adenosine-forming)